MKIICRLLLGFLGLSALLMLTPGWVRAAEPRTYRVNSMADTDDGLCEALAVGHNCTLREAINKANDHLANDIIKFEIPGCPCSIVVVGSGLPIITDPVTIDGFSQAGSHPNTLRNGESAIRMIELQGGQIASGADGLRIQASNTNVYGLAINGFVGAGIRLMPHNGPVKINGNAIGTGTPNVHGIVIETNSNLNLIGSANPVDRNVIQNNASDGILWSYLGAGTANDNEIVGNFIIDNGGSGIVIFHGKHNTIGGTGNAFRNVITGNGFYGIEITGSDSTRNVIAGNYIGVPLLSSMHAGNAQEGIMIAGGAKVNFVGGDTESSKNRIANNGSAGITIAGNTTRRNAIRRNAIWDNIGQGIDLGLMGFDGVTANDPMFDSDTGPNQFQNFPTITSASSATGKIIGELRSKQYKVYSVDIYMNLSCPGSGVHEGRIYLQTVRVGISGSGRETFTVTDWNFVPGRGITATATDPDGNTSEFSACVTAQ